MHDKRYCAPNTKFADHVPRENALSSSDYVRLNAAHVLWLFDYISHRAKISGDSTARKSFRSSHEDCTILEGARKSSESAFSARLSHRLSVGLKWKSRKTEGDRSAAYLPGAMPAARMEGMRITNGITVKLSRIIFPVSTAHTPRCFGRNSYDMLYDLTFPRIRAAR